MGAEDKLIDIEDVIRSKNPAILKWMPGTLLRYVKRIIHEDHINDFIRRHGDKRSFEFIREIILEFGAEVTFEGLENIPAQGGCIVVANHPIGGLDAMALMDVVSRSRKDQLFIVNDVLLNIRNLDEHFIGVNKHGKNAGTVLQKIDACYSGENVVMIFPAGLVSRKQKGKILDLEWKKSFVSKARKFKRNIIPVHISGRNSDFFYNLAQWRNRLGIKSNIEMFYLMDEMYHQFGKNIHIRIGKPIAFDVLDNSRSDHDWAQAVKKHVYLLPEGINAFKPDLL